MLFKRNNRSFKFCLLGLDYPEYNEISKLIIENGGEICETRNSPVITFSSCDLSLDNKPIFHVNYIRECLRYGKLLDLVHFQFGCREFAGCLMSIFIRGSSVCPSINDIGPCCPSTAFERRNKAPFIISHEHNYAQGDCATEGETNICSDMPSSALNSRSEDQRFLPDKFSQDSEFVPDASPRAVELLLDSSPRDSEFLPDDTPQDSPALPTGSPSDSEFLPDNSPQDPLIIPADSPHDSEFLPDESPQSPSALSISAPRDSEILPGNSPQDLSTLPAGLPPDRESPPAHGLQDSEFLPVELPSGLEVEVETHGSPRDSEFLPDESPLTWNVEKDFEVLSDESVSLSIGTIVPETPERSGKEMHDYSDTDIPELAIFEEHDSSRGVYGPVEDAISSKRSPATSVDTIVVPRRSRSSYSPCTLSEDKENPGCGLRRIYSQETLILSDTNQRRTSPSVNVGEIYSLSDIGEEVHGNEDPEKVDIEEEDEALLEKKLRWLKNSQSVTPERDTVSPVFKLKKTARKTLGGRRGTSTSPTILRDKSNRVKILGKGMTETLRDVENFPLSSTDSDVTEYVPSPAATEEDGRFKNLRLSVRIRNLNSNRQVLKKSSEVPGPSRESNTSEDKGVNNEISNEKEERETALRKERAEKESARLRKPERRKKAFRKGRDVAGPSKESEESSEDAEETEISSDGETTEKSTRLRKNVRRKARGAGTKLNESRVSNEGRNTMVSPTSSFDDVVLISSCDSDSSSEVEMATTARGKSAHSENRPKKTSDQPQGQSAAEGKRNRPKPFSRNFLPWEQREMVGYLIKNHFISEARGNRVWKQMLHDGYLPHRTFQSLNNHFRKFILPNISKFTMTQENRRMFEKLQQ